MHQTDISNQSRHTLLTSKTFINFEVVYRIQGILLRGQRPWPMEPLILGALLYYINNLLNKLSKENKTVFFLGDFNIALLNYDQHSVANVFLDSISSHMFVPHFVQPTRIRNNSNTLIYNIYSNIITPIGPSSPISHCSGYFV